MSFLLRCCCEWWVNLCCRLMDWKRNPLPLVSTHAELVDRLAIVAPWHSIVEFLRQFEASTKFEVESSSLVVVQHYKGYNMAS